MAIGDGSFTPNSHRRPEGSDYPQAGFGRLLFCCFERLC
jgi:hypothetical protein